MVLQGQRQVTFWWFHLPWKIKLFEAAGTSQRGIGGWTEKKQRSHPSVMSPGRYGMSGRATKVKQRPEPHHKTQVEGFEGPMRKVPQVMMHEGGVPVPCTRLQHLVNSEVFLEQKRRSDTTGFPSSRRKIRNGSP